MPDLFDSLEQLENDPTVQPLPAAEVRRRGDRMRRRRGAVEALAAVAVVVVLVAGAVLADGRSGAGPAPGPTTQGPTQSAAPDSLIRIPDGFPLATGYADPGGDGSLVGPSSAAKAALDTISVCGTRAYPTVPADNRLSVRLQAPEDFRAREVTTYADVPDAQRAQRTFVDAMRACPRETTGGTTAVTDATQASVGDESWAFTTTYENAGRPTLGLQVTTVSRVRNALLVSTQSNEGSARDAKRQLAEMMSVSQALLDELSIPNAVEPASLTSDGYGALRLTMNETEARDAGLTGLRGAASATCRTGRTADGGVVYLSRQHGVAGIFLGKGMSTDKGIGLGSTKADVLAAYPNGRYDVHGYWVTKPSAGVRLQVAVPHGTVEEVGLSLVDQDCFG